MKSEKSVVRKGKLTGAEVGRIMILDLVAAYKNLPDSGGLYTDAEKISMVNSLTNPEDIRRYNDFKYIHDYLSIAPAIYESYAKTYEVYYWRAYYLVKELKNAEEEYRRHRPVIMTQKQYDAFRKSSEDEDNPCYMGGVAVLQPSEFYPLDDISDDGSYVEPAPYWKSCLAENFIKQSGDFIRESITGLKKMLIECFARQTAVKLIGDFIDVPDVDLLLNPVDTHDVISLNDMMDSVTREICRYGDDRASAELKTKLKALLSPIDIKALSPTPEAIKKASRVLDFTTTQGSTEAFVDLLKRGVGGD